MKVGLWRRSSIFNKFLKPPKVINSLVYNKKIPQVDKDLSDGEVKVCYLGKSAVVTEKFSFPSNVRIGMLLPGGTDEKKEDFGVLQSIKNTFLGSKEGEKFSKLQGRGSQLRMDYNFDYALYEGFCLPCYLDEFLEVFKSAVFGEREEKDEFFVKLRHQEFWKGYSESSFEQANQEIVMKNLFTGGLGRNLHGDPERAPTIPEINTFVEGNFVNAGKIIYVGGIDDHAKAVESVKSLLTPKENRRVSSHKPQFQEKVAWELCSNTLSMFNLSFESFPVTDPRSRYLDLLTLSYTFNKNPSNIIKSLTSNHFSFPTTGALTFTATTSPANIEKTGETLQIELKNLLKTTQAEFDHYKSVYLHQSLQNFELPSKKLENYLRELFFFNSLTSPSATINTINNMTLPEFISTLSTLFSNKKNLTILSSLQKQKLNLDSFQIKAY